MQKLGFLSLILGIFLPSSFASAQTGIDPTQPKNLTPFQARVIIESDVEGAHTPRLLRIQLSEELAAQFPLDCKIVNRIGVPVFRFQLSTNFEDRKVRFLVPLPEDLDLDSFFFLSVQGTKFSLNFPLNAPEETP